MTLIVSLGVLAGAARRAEAWETISQSQAVFTDVVTLPNGDVAAAGDVGQDWLIARFDGVTGATLWNVSITGGSGAVPSADGAYPIAADANGDVFVAGVLLAPDDSAYRIAVVKLNGLTGDRLWSTLTDATGQTPGGLVVDASGNPIVPLSNSAGATGTTFRVLKLDGITGHVLWEYAPTGSGFNSAGFVALDGSGDVVAAGPMDWGTDGSEFAAVKLSGATGAEIWNQKLAAGTAAASSVLTLALESNGDVVLGGGTPDPVYTNEMAATVAELAAADGTVRWVRTLPHLGGTNEGVSALAVNGSGRIFAGYSDGHLFEMAAVEPTDGSLIWSKVSSELCDNFVFTPGTPRAARTLSNGDVIVTGDLAAEDYSIPGCTNACACGYDDLLAIRLSAADGSEIWRARQRYFNTIWYNIAITTNDDAVIAGSVGTDQPPYSSGAAVVRIDGTDGVFAVATPTPTTTTPTPTITPSPTPTTTAPPPLVGHLECFGTKDPRATATYSIDVFSSHPDFLPGALGCTLKLGAKQLCVEVTKQNVNPPPLGSGPSIPPNSSSLFVSYTIKCPTKATLSGILQDQFAAGGTFKPSIPSRLLVPAFPGPAINNPIECFKAKETPSGAKTPYTMDLIAGVSGFADETGCTIVNGKAKEICVQAEIYGVPTGGPGRGSISGEEFISYNLKCPATTGPLVNVVDPFGTGWFTASKSKTLLVPAQ